MKTINLSQYANPWFVATVSALTLVYVLTLFILLMTYQKNARYEMGHDWVSEVTRWPGNVRIVNELVQRPEDL